MPQRYDVRLQVRVRSQSRDEGGHPVDVWTDQGAPVWAARRDVSDAERWRADQVQAQIDVRFVIHWTATAEALAETDRLVSDGDTFEIIGVKRIGTRDRLEISARAIVDQ